MLAIRRTRAAVAKARRRPHTESGGDPGPILEAVAKFQPRFMVPYWVAPLADVLERAPDGRLRVVVSLPPRSGKTELFLAAFVVWLLRRPWLQFIYLTYGGKLAESKAGKALALAREQGVDLDPTSQAKKQWLTTQHGGLRASGIDQAVTGEGADVLIIDDPHKNRLDAESKAKRDNVWDLITGTAETRLTPNGSIIICQQRWHEDDAAGRALATGEFTEINIPAINEKGESFAPELWPVESLLRKKRIIGPYNWASQYEGRPAPRGGRLFFDVVLTSTLPTTGVVAIGVDLAHTARTKSDWCVAVAMLKADDGRCYVLDLRRRQARLADVVRNDKIVERGFARDIAELQARFPGARTVMHIGGKEDVILELMGALKDSPVQIEAIPATTDKWIRHQGYGAAWNRGEIVVPDAPWATSFVSEHRGFSGDEGDEDDQVDAGGSAFTALSEGEGHVPEAGGQERVTAGLKRGRLWT